MGRPVPCPPFGRRPALEAGAKDSSLYQPLGGRTEVKRAGLVLESLVLSPQGSKDPYLVAQVRRIHDYGKANLEDVI
jgi:hypothetical protein